MFEDPELPDFDSMSQEELIEWLEELAKIQGGVASEFIDDGSDLIDDASDEPAEAGDEDWSAWLDDTPSMPGTPMSSPDSGASVSDNFADADEETPIDLARFEARESAPLDAEAMAWLAEISAADGEEELPDITEYRPPAPPENFDELLTKGAQEEPLDWLDDQSNRAAGPRLPQAASEPPVADEAAWLETEIGDDFDDAYEDDEQLDDLDDESLYSRRSGETEKVLQSILGMEDRESEEYSTQSMAPMPDNAQPEASEETSAIAATAPLEPAAATPAAGDSLSQAYMLHAGQVDLEAWYLERLRAVASTGDSASQADAVARMEPIAAPAKPPPPGLAAAIYSARGKVEAYELSEALTDYETLLRTNAGLEWVIRDMRGLIAREEFCRNPSVHRVLGDALMRQGRLDAALDVYCHALALL
jgi:hypothetical protein